LFFALAGYLFIFTLCTFHSNFLVTGCEMKLWRVNVWSEVAGIIVTCMREWVAVKCLYVVAWKRAYLEHAWWVKLRAAGTWFAKLGEQRAVWANVLQYQVEREARVNVFQN